MGGKNHKTYWLQFENDQKKPLNYFVPIPGPPQLFWTGPGISFQLLLPTLSAQQASLPGQVLFSWTGPVNTP